MRRLLLLVAVLLCVVIPTTEARAHRERPVACKTANRNNFDGNMVHVRVKLTCINPSEQYTYTVKVVAFVATPVDYAKKSFRIVINSLGTEVRFFRVSLLRQGTKVRSAAVHIHNIARSEPIPRPME